MNDSDLTKRAREVLAGLGRAQTAVIKTLAESLPHLAEDGGWQRTPWPRAADRLAVRGVVDLSTHSGRATPTTYRLTDLGREVARLIAAGES